MLVIDDDPDVRLLLARALEARGYRVVVAENGAEGLLAVQEELPSLIVLDYWMPVLDGAGFMAGLADTVIRRPPVILFTAVEDNPRLAHDMGVDVYVEKPIHLARFLKLCEAVLRGGVPPVAQRRLQPRFAHRRPIEVRMPDGVRQPAFTIDVSDGGLGIELPAPPLAGARITVLCRLPDGRELEVEGEVRYSTPARIGLRLPADDRDAVATVTALLDEAARRT